MPYSRHLPTVFISSTVEDLKPYRQAARDAAVHAGFQVEMMEYLLPGGRHPPREACKAKVAEADLVVTIVAHQYGWVPDETDARSIIWLQCLEARRLGMEVLAFVVDKHRDWPVEWKEPSRIARLADFEEWLTGLGICASFRTPEVLREQVELALRDWRARHPGFVPPSPRPHDHSSAYLAYLLEQTAWIEGLYIPSTTLEDALPHERLLIVGDPGSGKTMFLRHIAYLWVRALQDTHTDTLLFPIFVRIPELVEHILQGHGKAGRPPAPDSPACLIGFLNSQNQKLNWGLHEQFFHDKLTGGLCLLLLDGLSEAPGNLQPSVARLIENAAQAWRHCRFVVAARPLSFAGLAGFETVHIEPEPMRARATRPTS